MVRATSATQITGQHRTSPPAADAITVAVETECVAWFADVKRTAPGPSAAGAAPLYERRRTRFRSGGCRGSQLLIDCCRTGGCPTCRCAPAPAAITAAAVPVSVDVTVTADGGALTVTVDDAGVVIRATVDVIIAGPPGTEGDTAAARCPGTCLLEAYWPTVDREPAKPASLGSPAARGPGLRTPQRRQSQGSGHGFRGCLLTTRQLIERRWMIAEEALV